MLRRWGGDGGGGGGWGWGAEKWRCFVKNEELPEDDNSRDAWN